MKKRKAYRKFLASALSFVIFIFSSTTINPLTVKQVQAEGTEANHIYYVDAVNGDDSNTGENESSAWKSLEKVSSFTFLPGDKILFKSGDIFTGQLVLKGTGTAEAPIVIDQYGSGPKPILDAQGSTENDGAVILLENTEGWEINNLYITSHKYRTGILVIAEDYGTVDHIYIQNCTIVGTEAGIGEEPRWTGFGDRWCNLVFGQQGGIIFRLLKGAEGEDYPEYNPTRLNDIKVENNSVTLMQLGVQIGSEWMDTGDGGRNLLGEATYSTNISIKNNTFTDLWQASVNIHACDGYVGDGVIIENNVDTTSFIYSCAQIWVYVCKGVVIQENEVYDIPVAPPGHVDFGAVDIDGMCEGVLAQYNYTHNVAGEAAMMCNWVDSWLGTKYGMTAEQSQAFKLDGFLHNNVIRYNISQNDNWYNGDLKRAGTLMIENRTNSVYGNSIYNNTVYSTGNGNSTILNISGNNSAYNNVFYVKGGGYQAKFGMGDNAALHDCNAFYGVTHNGAYEENGVYLDEYDSVFVNGGEASLGRETCHAYDLADTSPLRGYGRKVLNNGGRDFFGNELSESITDIGAVKYMGSAALPPRKPLPQRVRESVNLIQNPGFKESTANWILKAGDAAISMQRASTPGPDNEPGRLNVWNSNSDTQKYRAEQTIENCAAGIYTAKAWIAGGGNATAYLGVSVEGGTPVETQFVNFSWNPYIQETVTGILVGEGQSVTVYVRGDLEQNSGTGFDDFELTFVPVNLVDNPSFDNGLNGWASTETASPIVNNDGGYTGEAYLSMNGTNAFKLEQTLVCKEGTYYANVWAKHSNSNDLRFGVSVNGVETARTMEGARELGWVCYGIDNIKVNEGDTVKLYLYADLGEGQFAYFDDIGFYKETEEPTEILPIGVNLLQNPGFESGTADWSHSAQAFPALKEDGGHTGNNYLELTEPVDYWMHQVPEFITAGTYTMTAWVKHNLREAGSDDTDVALQLSVYANGKETKCKIYGSSGNEWRKYEFDVDVSTPGSWFAACLYADLEEGEWAKVDDFEFFLKSTQNSEPEKDTTAPVITIGDYNTNPTNQDITVTASTNEGMLNAASHIFTENGSFTFTATDAAGNTSHKTVDISNIDKIAPVITVTNNISGGVPGSAITFYASTNEGLLNATEHTFTTNGSFTFVAVDAAGNAAEYTVSVDSFGKGNEGVPDGGTVVTPQPTPLPSDDKKIIEQTASMVVNAEKNLSAKSIIEAQKAINALPESTEKDALQQRLDTVNKTIESTADKAIAAAKKAKTASAVRKAQKVIDNVVDVKKKTEMQKNLDKITAVVDKKNITAAAKALAAVEKKQTAVNVKKAQTAITKMLYSNQKVKMQAKLEKIIAVVDKPAIAAADKAVAKAETSITKANILAAQRAIDKMINSSHKDELQKQLDNIKNKQSQ